MNYYYCHSKWHHAVVEAKTAKSARERFMGIINAELEDNKKILFTDVVSVVVNVFPEKPLAGGFSKKQVEIIRKMIQNALDTGSA